MQTLLVLTAVGLILYYIINHFYQHFTFWQRQGVPAYPFVNFGWATKPFFKFVEESTAKYGAGKIYGGYSPFGKILILNDARLARDLSTKELHKFAIRNNQFYQGTTNITKSLFFMEANEDWKRIRSIVTPAFTSGKLRRMISPIERIADNFVQHMRPHAEKGDEFDLKKYIGGFAMDVIACCGYGIELDSVRTPNHPVVVNAKKILNVDISLSGMLCFMLPRVAELFKLEVFDRDAINYFDKLTFDIVEKRIQQTETKQNPDLLGLMIESANEGSQSNGNSNGNSNGHSNGQANGQSNGHTNGHASNGFSEKLKGISKDEMSGQGIIFFIAGFDTTHATFDHAIYYLCKYPEWQEKLYQELAPVKDELDYDKFKNLPILNAIINETLRLNPPLTVAQRESVADCELLDTGIKIPKNTLISIQPHAIHRNPEYFPDPLAFKPERFLGDKSKSAESHFAFIPFGVGPRLCVGMRFAQNELRIGLANLILNYKVNMDPSFELEYFIGSVLMSPKSLMVRISER